LTDDRKNWKPDRFGYSVWGCKVEIQFPVVKLLDYFKDWDYLEDSHNPFAVVVMTHLKSLETRKDPDSRLKWKLSLVKRLYRKGYSREDILELFRFIDWIMTLPEALEKRFSDEMYEYEEEMKMPYVTSVERMGIKKGQLMGIELGRQEGRQEGMLLTSREAVTDVIEARFEAAPKSMINRIRKIDDTAVLKVLLKKAIHARSLKEFKEIMDNVLV